MAPPTQEPKEASAGVESPAPDSPRFEVRRMTPDDLEAVMAIERAAFKHPWSAELFRRELQHDWSTILLAVTPAAAKATPGAIHGFIIFWLVHDEVHVLNVATDPAFRRQGIARQLMLAAIEQGRLRRARLMTLEVRRSNAAAITLYRDLGFAPVGIRPNYYLDEHEDALVMNAAL